MQHTQMKRAPQLLGSLKSRVASSMGAATLTALSYIVAPPALAAPPTIAIAQYPLTVAVPAHPQVLFALANSQSTDGDLSGAIWTGAGALGANYAGLYNSSSPVNFTVPGGFVAPITGTTAGNTAPYTIVGNPLVYPGTVAGRHYDNSASRLNVAKAGISSILQNFLANADFALMDYQTSAPGLYSTWVYYMSPPGGFQFTNDPTMGNPNNYPFVLNPCYNIPLDFANPVDSACTQLNTRYPGINTYTDVLINSYSYMYGAQNISVAGTSDDPGIVDVLYAGGLPAVFVDYSGPNPASPFGYTLWTYENGGVWECYGASVPSFGGICETPTNAGFVPYSTEVMQALRGFGYYTGSETAQPSSNTSWPPLVPMTSAGQVPTAGSIAAAEAAFQAYLAPETNNAGTLEIKAQATQSPIAGMLKAGYDYYVAANPASTNGCAPNRYIVLVTDGLPTMDLAGHSWPPLGSLAAAGWNVTATFNADGSLTPSNTNDQALADTINTLTTLYNNGQPGSVKTYIIAVGAGVNGTDAAAQTLTAMAIAGGTGQFFPATNPQQLNQAMQIILAKILAETAATSASAVNSTGVNTKSVAYQGQFTTSDTFQDWTGNVFAFPINVQTGAIDTSSTNAYWAAQAQLDAQNWDTGRIIATWDPVTGAGTPFRWDPNPTATHGIASSTALGAALETFAPDNNGQDVLQFLRGSNAQEVRLGGQFRNRTHKLGDIVDSAPAYVAAPRGAWLQQSYLQFSTQYANRKPVIYIGADDGMLHAIDATTAQGTSGNELFAYIPHGVYNNLVKLVNPYYNSQHLFYVDGSPQVQDVQFSDSTWHTVLVGGERAGGNSIYALDVTDPTTITTETALAQHVLWDFTDANMGMTFGNPLVANTSAGITVFFGNGYDSPTGTPFLYALNPQTGAVLTKIDLCAAVPTACNLALANGLSSVTAYNAYGSVAGPMNVLYAGDLQGNLWRVDISNSNPSLWTVTVLFQARDASGNPEPITDTPAVGLNPNFPVNTGTMVYFATGQFLSVADLTTTQQQTVYGVFDSGSESATPLLRANLIQQVLTSQNVQNSQGTTISVRLLSNNPVNLINNPGWYVDLGLAAGERAVTDPVLFNGTVQLTTYQPNGSTCVGGGNGFLLVFNYATGGSTSVPQFDWYGSGHLNSSDMVNGQTVAGVSLGSNYGTSPTILTGTFSNTTIGAIAYITLGGATKNGNLTGGNTGDVGCTGLGTSCGANGNSEIAPVLEAVSSARSSWQEIKQ